MCKDSPDNSGINAAALANAEIAKEALDFYKQSYAEQAPARDAAAKMAMDVAGQQLASSKQNDAISQDYWNYQKDTFRPLEEGIVDAASKYDTTARRDEKAAGAVADVGMQAELARQAQVRQQQRMGVNPSSGKTLAMQSQMGLSEAAMKAGAANTARDKVELMGNAMKMDAASLGRGLAANQATSAGVALNAGNSAVGNAGTPLAQAQAATSMMGQGFNTAVGANNSAGSLYGSAAKIEADASSGLMGDLATIGMAGAKLFGPTSDVNAKQNIKPMSDEQALKAIEKTPVSTWDYKKGEGDGGRHTGPMAQEVNKNMGEQAAPGGKKLDLITMNGVTMAGMAALARKVDKLSKKIEGATA
jgi:hypothetical protein